MNARFWIYWNEGWIKITLGKGESIALTEGGATDEGYSYIAVVYTNDGDGVLRETMIQASDCDGRIDRQQDDYCPYTDLYYIDQMVVYPCFENEGIFRPDWQRLNASQRDYAAEAMGY